jgi:Tfp pilus assembly protein PilF
MNSISAALNDMDTAIRIDPSSAMAYYERAEIEQLLGQSDDVKADINKAHALDPSIPNYAKFTR